VDGLFRQPTDVAWDSEVMFVGEPTFPGRIFKVSLDGKALGVIGRSGRQLNSFPRARAGVPLGA
jgi:hypothetical protein